MCIHMYNYLNLAVSMETRDTTKWLLFWLFCNKCGYINSTVMLCVSIKYHNYTLKEGILGKVMFV